jgi:hypothetical protein
MKLGPSFLLASLGAYSALLANERSQFRIRNVRPPLLPIPDKPLSKRRRRRLRGKAKP